MKQFYKELETTTTVSEVRPTSDVHWRRPVDDRDPALRAVACCAARINTRLLGVENKKLFCMYRLHSGRFVTSQSFLDRRQIGRASCRERVS